MVAPLDSRPLFFSSPLHPYCAPARPGLLRVVEALSRLGCRHRRAVQASCPESEGSVVGCVWSEGPPMCRVLALYWNRRRVVEICTLK